MLLELPTKNKCSNEMRKMHEEFFTLGYAGSAGKDGVFSTLDATVAARSHCFCQHL